MKMKIIWYFKVLGKDFDFLVFALNIQTENTKIKWMKANVYSECKGKQ